MFKSCHIFYDFIYAEIVIIYGTFSGVTRLHTGQTQSFVYVWSLTKATFKHFVGTASKVSLDLICFTFSRHDTGQLAGGEFWSQLSVQSLAQDIGFSF